MKRGKVQKIRSSQRLTTANLVSGHLLREGQLSPVDRFCVSAPGASKLGRESSADALKTASPTRALNQTKRSESALGSFSDVSQDVRHVRLDLESGLLADNA
jgi:hypothetical protein